MPQFLVIRKPKSQKVFALSQVEIVKGESAAAVAQACQAQDVHACFAVVNLALLVDVEITQPKREPRNIANGIPVVKEPEPLPPAQQPKRQPRNLAAETEGRQPRNIAGSVVPDGSDPPAPAPAPVPAPNPAPAVVTDKPVADMLKRMATPDPGAPQRNNFPPAGSEAPPAAEPAPAIVDDGDGEG